MGLEAATYVGDFVPSNPPTSDLVTQGANHIQLIKTVLQNSFPSLERAIYFQKFATKTGNYTILSTDDQTVFLVDTTTGNITLTLPSVPANPWKISILKISNDANTITVAGTVQGGSLNTLATLNDTYTIGGNGSAFYLLDFHVSSLISYAGIQHVAASSLLGNPTSGSATMEEITLGTGLSFSGTVLNSTTDASQFSGFLAGLWLSAAGSSNTFTCTLGAAVDSTSAALMRLLSTYTKTTSAWAVGSGNGALDTSTISAAAQYFVFLIKRLDTGVVDLLISLSATAPTMPTNYTVFRRIGVMFTIASQWLAFTQINDDITLGAVVTATTGTAPSVSRTLVSLNNVPSTIPVKLKFRANFLDASGGTFMVTSPYEADIAPSQANCSIQVGTNLTSNNATLDVMSTTGQVGVRSTSPVGTYTLNPCGWSDTRGR